MEDALYPQVDYDPVDAAVMIWLKDGNGQRVTVHKV
jgi:hypothetical protein